MKLVSMLTVWLTCCSQYHTISSPWGPEENLLPVSGKGEAVLLLSSGLCLLCGHWVLSNDCVSLFELAASELSSEAVVLRLAWCLY